MYATKSYELTAVRLLVCIESWTAFKVGTVSRLLAVDVAARSRGTDDSPTKKRVRIDADNIVANTFDLRVSFACMVTCYRTADRRHSR